MSVFLRVRPFAAHEVGSEENQVKLPFKIIEMENFSSKCWSQLLRIYLNGLKEHFCKNKTTAKIDVCVLIKYTYVSQGCVEVKNNYMVTAIAPKDSHTYKAQLYGLNKARHTFTFSRVFPESTTQKEFFDSTMLKLVQDFIEGQNCLVFTYGVTNSGKTYTIQGEEQVFPDTTFILVWALNLA